MEWIWHSLGTWPQTRNANVKSETPLETYIANGPMILTLAKVAAKTGGEC